MSAETIKQATDNVEPYALLIPLESSNPPPMAAALFTGWTGDMIEAEARATETPRELAAMFVLAVLGACCQNKFTVRPEPGYFEPLSLWALAALESGNRKSAVMQSMTRPLVAWEREQAEALKLEVQRAEETTETIKARIQSLRGQAAKAKDNDEFRRINAQVLEAKESMPEIPRPPRVWAQDITPEHTGTVMANNNSRLAILSSEGGIFDILAGRYNGGLPNLDLFLQAHSGDPVRVDRGSRAPVYMEHPALSIGLSPQPDVLRGLASKPGFRGRGLLARFLYTLPRSPLGFRKLTSQPVDKKIATTYQDNVRALLEMQPGTDDEGQERPHVLKLSGAAWKEWKEFSRVVEANLREGGKFELITDWAGKLPGAAIRIAGLLHCAEHARGQPWGTEISIDTMNRALTLAAVLSEHALAVFDMMGADPALDKARKVWGWVEQNRTPKFSARDCFEAVKGTFKRMAKLNPAFDVLIERHYLFEASKVDEQPGPGRPSRVFIVNPVITGKWQ